MNVTQYVSPYTQWKEKRKIIIINTLIELTYSSSLAKVSCTSRWLSQLLGSALLLLSIRFGWLLSSALSLFYTNQIWTTSIHVTSNLSLFLHERLTLILSTCLNHLSLFLTLSYTMYVTIIVSRILYLNYPFSFSTYTSKYLIFFKLNYQGLFNCPTLKFIQHC